MIYCSPVGGIGNCLYIFAATFAHAKRNGFDYAIPLINENPHYVGQKPYLFAGLNYCEALPDLPSYNEPFFHYQEIPAIDNVILKGYFQSELYFHDYKEEFINALGLNWELKEDTISIHVRRSDYLKLQNFHPVIDTLYLDRAITYYFGKGFRKFICFSDDMDWCYENINSDHFTDCEFEYSEGRTELEDLVLGSCCFSQIGSNSSFSVWQHILNRNPYKTCFLPKNWFGPSVNHNTTDLYPKNSIIL